MNDQALVQAQDAELVPPDQKTLQLPVAQAQTPQQLRVMEVNEALLPAYQKASTLELTDGEVEALMSPFPDQTVDVRPHDGLIFISHIHISNRLNKVFKPGKWALICRRHWIEGGIMYGEYVLLIRGCYIGESTGGHPYQPNNPKVNFSDTLESTAAEALRRIAGKRLSCGSQVWEPEYARQWVAKFGEQFQGKWHKKQATPQGHPAPKTTTPAKPADVLPKVATEATRKFFVDQSEPVRQQLTVYLIDKGRLLPNETLEDLPLDKVPTSRAEILAMHKEALEYVGEAPGNEPTDSDDADAAWRSFPMLFGKHAGVKLCDLDKKYLFGLWANYKVETEYNGRAKKPETIAKDKAFRVMLDDAGEHYNFETPLEEAP